MIGQNFLLKIDYKLLDDSINFYEENAFQDIETPCTISEFFTH